MMYILLCMMPVCMYSIPLITSGASPPLSGRARACQTYCVLPWYSQAHGNARCNVTNSTSYMLEEFQEGAINTSLLVHMFSVAFSLQVGVDEDIMVEPALYLWSPTEERDKPWRKFQHFLWPVPFSALFAMWRIDSIKTALKLKLWPEIVALSLHYVALLSLVGPGVALGHIMLGGLLTATIVTVTHTAEEMLMDDEMSFVEAQFRTTRDAKCTDPLSEYVWGGMQYQLEHHLFPTLPRYKYARLVPVIKQWAAENGLEYRVTGAWKIIADNVNQLKRVAAQPTDANSPSPNSA
eukprot:TRINITY_DN1617_c0_g1_i1.p1 TRINITY_DN1617_c0_g1~~TRINITY_DN1617_c0_g1_i1.p1  ORF type:complete len:294 (+),score=28.42 TRINITY_DN1617_c0_g1_i1:371-1252(+)